MSETRVREPLVFLPLELMSRPFGMGTAYDEVMATGNHAPISDISQDRKRAVGFDPRWSILAGGGSKRQSDCDPPYQ
jgi:hypothetical protein